MISQCDLITTTTQSDMYHAGEQARAEYWRDSVLLLPAVPMFYSEDSFKEIGDLCASALQYQRIDQKSILETH